MSWTHWMVTFTKWKRPHRDMRAGKAEKHFENWPPRRCTTKWHEEVLLQLPTKRNYYLQRLNQGGLLKVGVSSICSLIPTKQKLKAYNLVVVFIYLFSRQCNKLYLYRNDVQKTNKQPPDVDNKPCSEQKDEDIWLSILHLSWFSPVSILLKIDTASRNYNSHIPTKQRL